MGRIQIFAIVSGLVLLILVLEMVRRRRLREEYSWLWLLTAIVYLLVAIWPRLAEWVTKIIGAENPTSVFLLLGLTFLFLLCIQFSVQISRLSEHNKDLAQHIAILDSELRRLAELNGSPASDSPPDALSPQVDTCHSGASRDDAQRADG